LQGEPISRTDGRGPVGPNFAADDPNLNCTAFRESHVVITINPDNAEAYNTLGSIHQISKRYDEAADAYREAIRRNPKLVQAYVNLGLVFMHKGMTDEALEACKRATEIDPKNAEAHYYLGKVYLQKGMPKEAADEFTKHKQLSSTARP